MKVKVEKIETTEDETKDISVYVYLPRGAIVSKHYLDTEMYPKLIRELCQGK